MPCADWPGVLEDEEVVGGDVEVGIVDAGWQVVQRGEDDGAAGALEQFRVRGGPLDDGPGRGEGTEQRDEAAVRADGVGKGRMTARSTHGSASSSAVAERLARDGARIEFEQVAEAHA